MLADDDAGDVGQDDKAENAWKRDDLDPSNYKYQSNHPAYRYGFAEAIKSKTSFVTIIEYLGAVAVYKDEMRMPKKARDSISSFGESPPCPLSYVAGDGQKLERTPPNDKLPENFGPDSLDGIGIERGSQHVVCVQGLRITGPCSLLIRGRKCSGRSDPLGECEGWIVGVSCGEAREVSVHHGVKDRGQQTEMHG